MFCSVFSSDIITFEVGPEHKIFSMHAKIVASQSTTLDILINGNMKEARAKHVRWKDTEVDTFLHFCQFAYTGDYSIIQPPLFKTPPMRVTTATSASTQTSEAKSATESAKFSSLFGPPAPLIGQPAQIRGPVESGIKSSLLRSTIYELDESGRPKSVLEPARTPSIFGSPVAAVSQPGQPQSVIAPVKSHTLFDQGTSTVYQFGPPKRQLLCCKSPTPTTLEPWKNDTWKKLDQTFSSMCLEPDPLLPKIRLTGSDKLAKSGATVSLRHAHCYVFADYHDIPNLRNLALHKLKNALLETQRESIIATHVSADLVRYCYENTATHDNKIDPLREMVTLFMARNLRRFWSCPAIKSLIKEGGDFAEDLFSAVLKWTT